MLHQKKKSDKHSFRELKEKPIKTFENTSKFFSVEQYPDIAPPQINISATYTGASAQTVENSVTQIIEQQLTGLDGMIYFSSSSSSAGTARIKVTFQQGTDPDIAHVQVQNKVEQILSRLPDDVQKQGVRVAKAQTDFLLLAVIITIV